MGGEEEGEALSEGINSKKKKKLIKIISVSFSRNKNKTKMLNTNLAGAVGMHER